MRKPKSSPSPAPGPTEEEIQKQAYHLWVEGGCLEGVEAENWFEAKELLSHRHGHAGGRLRQPVRPNAVSSPTTTNS